MNEVRNASKDSQSNLSSLKVAIVHDYLHEYGGAEGVVNAIWEIFPQADIYTATYNKEVMDKAGAFQGAKIHYPEWRNNIPGSIKRFTHKVLIANLPIYFEHLDLSKYDLVISSTAHFAKGVKTRPNQLHISYIHTPPRFLYGLQGEIRKRDSFWWKIILNPLDAYLRHMDKNFAKRPDYLLCNSEVVRERIKKFYDRDAVVINPFPAVNVSQKDFEEAKNIRGDYYLIVSRLAAYKNIDLAIKTCGENNIKLKIAGMGPAEDRLKDLTKKYSSVEMLGFISQDEKKNLYKNCKAVICAVKDEDFGMAPLEPMLFGKPVVALREGGYLETVNPEVGVFFNKLTEESLLAGIKNLEEKTFDAHKIREHAMTFSKENFKKKFEEFVGEKLEIN